MKKLFILFVAVFTVSAVNAQSLVTSESKTTVPTNVKIAFKNAYKSTAVEWSANPGYYVAKWVDNGSNMTASYAKTDEVTLIRTEKEVALTELSSGSQTTVGKFLGNGSQYTFVRAVKVEHMTDAVEGCEFQMSGGNKIIVFFDATGNMVKREITQ